MYLTPLDILFNATLLACCVAAIPMLLFFVVAKSSVLNFSIAHKFSFFIFIYWITYIALNSFSFLIGDFGNTLNYVGHWIAGLIAPLIVTYAIFYASVKKILDGKYQDD